VQFDKGSGTTVPPSAWVSVRKMRRMREILTSENNGEPPTLCQLSEALDWTLEQTEFVINLEQLKCVSLDAPLADKDEVSVGELIANPAPLPDDEVADAQSIEVVLDLVDRLPNRERAQAGGREVRAV
jgi:DNA-directed RNA polymerase sigma subunit (sigma70/sigma32)